MSGPQVKALVFCGQHVRSGHLQMPGVMSHVRGPKLQLRGEAKARKPSVLTEAFPNAQLPSPAVIARDAQGRSCLSLSR